MKRDPRLIGLSHQHHHALVLARHVRVALGDPEALQAVRAELLDRHEEWLEPHFVLEEELLLPALAEAGHGDLADTIRAQHRELRRLFTTVPGGSEAELSTFAYALHDHVRFEERTLFPICEEVLPSTLLDELARRTEASPAGEGEPA